MPRFTFGPFLLDSESRALLRDGERLPLAGRILDTLVVLVQNRGRLLEKDELLSLIWPDTVVDEANLSQSIFTLRKLLGDSRKDQRYIATVAGRGYQFVAPVTELRAETSQPPGSVVDARPEAALDSRLTSNWIWRHQRLAIAAAALIAVAAAGLFWAVRRPPASALSQIVERRLTFNSSASEVTSAVISPDGKYLAYSDPAGIHVRLLSTGEERLIPPIAVNSPAASLWVDSWFPNGTEVLGHSREADGRGGIWTLSIMGQSLRELHADAVSWAVSPDGTHIAFSPTKDGYAQPEIWVMGGNGEHPRKVLSGAPGEHVWSARWSPDGHRLAYIRAQPPRESLETCDLNGANRTTIAVAPGLGQWVRSVWWLPGNRIVYSQAEAADVDANLWNIHVNAAGVPVDKAKRITRWTGVDVQGLSANADGTRLVVRKETFPSQIYIAELEPGRKRVRPPQRLSNDEAVDWATAWTADSKAVVFTSDRGGKWGVFKQGIREQTAEPLIEGRDSANLARLSPDGSWILYSESSLLESGRSRNYKLMRVPVNGGAPKLIYATSQLELQDYVCARAPANRCVVIEVSQDRRRLTVAALDPLNGKDELLRTVDKDIHTYFHHALSPDGSTLALGIDGEPVFHIRLLSLTGGSDREITVKGWPNLASMEWSTDGQGLYCGSVTSQGGTLVYVDLKGTAQIVTQSKEVGGGSFVAGVPSPDGRYLALTGAIRYSNAWLIEAF